VPESPSGRHRRYAPGTAPTPDDVLGAPPPRYPGAPPQQLSQQRPPHHRDAKPLARPTGPQRTAKPRPADRSGWHWLLVIPVALPLFTPLYNRVEPRLIGLPFFYWCQLAFVVISMMIVGLVHLATWRRK
jgi:Protein of unknown function (DUF3311)